MAYAIRITWQEGTPQRQGNGFRIYRSVNGGAFSLYATVPISQTSYDDTNIAAGNYYRYAVCEYKVLQYGTGESPWAYTDTIFCPAPPSRIRMTYASGQRTVYWDAPGLQQGYEIERSVNGGSWTYQTTLSASATSWTQSGLSAGNKYRYRIRSVGTAAWRSDWAYTEGSYYGIKVTWTEGAPDKPGQGFRIYRKRSDEPNYTLQAELPITTTSYNDANVTQNYSYTYKIVEWKGWLEDEPAYITAAVPIWSPPNNQPQNLTVSVIND